MDHDFWDVADDDGTDFTRKGSLITKCPACPERKGKLNDAAKDRLANVRELAWLLGDDFDGFAAMLDESGLAQEASDDDLA